MFLIPMIGIPALAVGYAAGVRAFLAAAIVTAVAASGAPALGQSAQRLQYMGINLAGAEFGQRRLPGRAGRDYTYPTRDDIDYFLAQGFNTIRLPFRWERLQRELGGDLDSEESARIDEVVTYVTEKDAHVILDPHNYAKYFGAEIGSRQVPVAGFTAFWAKLANRYKSNGGVIFGLMNEPHTIRADRWRRIVDAAIAEIRATGATNLILVPGTAWTGAHSWLRPRVGVSNASAFRTLTDPANNVVFEVHQYLDSDSSGRSSTCRNPRVGAKSLEKFTRWLRDVGHRGFLGEFGVADNAVCLEALDRMLQHIRANADVWIGWTYWAAGRWWGDYHFSVHPSPDGRVKPQLEVLKRHLGAD